MRGRMLALLGGFLPILVIAALSMMFLAFGHIQNESGGAGDGNGPAMLERISTDLSQLSIVVIGGCAFLLREGGGISRKFWVLGSAVLAASIGSYYSGYRYRVELAQQLAVGHFNPDGISLRLSAQGALLLVAVCALVSLTLLTYASKISTDNKHQP